MAKIWCFKSPNSLTNEEKDLIIKKVFNSIVNNDLLEDIGEEIFSFTTAQGYVYSEEIED